MNYLRLSLAAGVLTVLLALPAFAGYMDTTVTSPQPTTGEMETTRTVVTTDQMETPLTEITLSLMQSVLALL
jgi:hypothetical protein